MSGNRARRQNYLYANALFCPPSAMPGFAFHQTDRSLDNPNRGIDHVVRDFDWFGARYSLLSSLAHAPLNTVVCQQGARDLLEFELLPAFVTDDIKWMLQFADNNTELLRHTRPLSGAIATTCTSSAGPTGRQVSAVQVPSGEPSRYGVDGSFAIIGNEGVLFLFNPAPNASFTPTELVIDGRTGFNCAEVPPGSELRVTELWPNRGTLIGNYTCGDSLAGIPLNGRDARLW